MLASLVAAPLVQLTSGPAFLGHVTDPEAAFRPDRLHDRLSLRGRRVHGSGRLYFEQRLRRGQFLRMQQLRSCVLLPDAG